MERDHANHVELMVQRGIEVQGLVILMAELEGDRLSASLAEGAVQFEVARKVRSNAGKRQIAGHAHGHVRYRRLLSRIGIFLDDGAHQAIWAY